MPRPRSALGAPKELRVVPASHLSLSGEWRFCLDPVQSGLAMGWAAPAFDDSSWSLVDVPHTWNAGEVNAGYEGLAWYRRRFRLPPSAAEAHVRLRFEAVNYLANIWVNGDTVGVHEGGYTPFELDITNLASHETENVIAVLVDNERTLNRLPAALPEGRSFGWRNYGGIVRPVSLLVTSRAFVDTPRIVAIPHLVRPALAESALITTTITVHNRSEEWLIGRLEAKIVEEETGNLVVMPALSGPLELSPGQSTEIAQTVTLPSPRLWDFDHPRLYRWSTSLRDDTGRALHTSETTFGVRSIELKEGAFFLNGEPMRLVGVSRHADVPGHGLAETDEAAAADYNDLKCLNQVFTRPVHYPQSEFVLDYCDRHGALLIPEVPAWQLTANQMADPRIKSLERQQLTEMILSEFNHPCVWAWSVGNELESDTAAGREFVREMIACAKSLDPTRPVGFASYHLLGGRPWADATASADFVLMNEYFGTWHGPRQALGPALDLVHATWPEKTVFVSEFGFAPRWEEIEGPSLISPDQYYHLSEKELLDPARCDLPRQQVIREHMEVFRSHPYVAGAIFWTYQDQGMGGFGMGVVDEARRHRGSWEVLRREFAPLRIESIQPVQGTGGGRVFVITLRTRGPLVNDMPAYSLRDYTLRWSVLDSVGGRVVREGRIALPELVPGSVWKATLEMPMSDEQILRLAVDRPTGFPVADGLFDPRAMRVDGSES